MDKLFCDLKTDEEKSAFFLSGRGYETGVISQAIQNDVAMAYHRCVEYKLELEAMHEKYWNIYNSHKMLLDKLGLQEVVIPQKTVLREKDIPEQSQ